MGLRALSQDMGLRALSQDMGLRTLAIPPLAPPRSREYFIYYKCYLYLQIGLLTQG